MHVLIHLFKPYLFVAEDFTDKDAAFVPAHVSTVVYPPSLKRLRILERGHVARQHPGAWHIDASGRLVGKGLMWALMVKHQTETVELLLLRRHRACRRLGRILLQ